MGLWTWLTEHAGGARPALTGDCPVTTYDVLRRRVGGTVAWLAAQGTRPGDVVAIALPKERAFLEVFLACVASGRVALPMNHRATAAERDHAIQDAGARLVVEVAPEITEAAPPQDVAHTDDLAALLYTSGTTGRPKGATHKAASFDATVDNGVVAHDLGENDV